MDTAIMDRISKSLEKINQPSKARIAFDGKLNQLLQKLNDESASQVEQKRTELDGKIESRNRRSLIKELIGRSNSRHLDGEIPEVRFYYPPKRSLLLDRFDANGELISEQVINS